MAVKETCPRQENLLRCPLTVTAEGVYSVSLDYPRLRYIEAMPVEEAGRTRIYIRDPLNYAQSPLLLPYPTYFVISHFDGQHSLVDIQEAFARQFGQILPREQLHDI